MNGQNTPTSPGNCPSNLKIKSLIPFSVSFTSSSANRFINFFDWSLMLDSSAVMSAEKMSFKAAFSFGPVGVVEDAIDRKLSKVELGMRAANSGVEDRCKAI